MYLKDQCGQIGTRYLEFLGNTFTAKVAQMFVAFLGSCESHRFLSQTGEASFGQLF